MESLQHRAARGSHRPLLALVLAGSVIVLPALLLAHSQVPAHVVATGPTALEVRGAASAAAARAARAEALAEAVGDLSASPVVAAGQLELVASPPVLRPAPHRTSPSSGSSTSSWRSTTTSVTRPPAPPVTAPPATRPPPPPTTAPPPPPTTAPPAHSQTGQASWYNGPAGACAHPTLPIGTVITVTNLANGATATCTVETRGPFGAGRIVDLDQTTFAKLAPLSQGVINVRITW